MRRIDILKRGIGINFQEDGKATIVVYAPLARKISIAARNDNVHIQLSKDEYGFWETITNEISPACDYKIIIDDTRIFPDPASLHQPYGVHEWSRTFDLKDFKWSDAHWKNTPLKDYVIYELHIGTFSPESSFEGLEKKLDHLIDLGITAIELMPVAQFPGTRNWGYDGVYPFAVQNSYGGAKGLQSLVNHCHSKNLAVVLDVVYNHIGPEGNYLAQFAPYFTDKYKTPWGQAINFDDEWCDGIRHFFFENALMWFRDFHIDALRLDAVHAIFDFSANHILSELKLFSNRLSESNKRDYHLIIETDLNDSKYINRQESGGYGLDAQWLDDLHHSLHVTVTGENNGYYADFNGIEHLAKAFSTAYVYDGNYSFNRKKSFGTTTKNNPGSQFIIYSQNHDQVGNRLMGERLSILVDFEFLKLIGLTIMMAPFVPLLFMGQEWGCTQPFLYFVSHSDQELVEAVRRGRNKEFRSFHGSRESPDPNSEETFSQSFPDWSALLKQPHADLYAFYRTIISLRKKVFNHYGYDRNFLEANGSVEQKTLTLHRWKNDNHLICLLNFSEEEQRFRFDQYDLNTSFDSSKNNWRFQSYKNSSQQKDHFIAPHSGKILTNHGL